jgi:transcriptional regulator with XRE-family HTH domain
MEIIAGELDRVLTLLRNRIRERGFTQLEVQKQLGWGRSYISQLLTKQKALRVEQVLLILQVVGADPGGFFAELFPPQDIDGLAAVRGQTLDGSSATEPGGIYDRAGRERQSLVELRSLVRGLVGLLADKELIDLDDLTSAVRDLNDD